MSAIRPLATIAMLMVLGYFLWTRINTPGLEATEENGLALAGVPPLSVDTTDGSNTLDNSPPPFVPGGAPLAEPTTSAPPAEFSFGPTPEPEANNTITPLDASSTAAMPDLPPLPDSIPTADYSASPGTATGNVPSLGTQVPAPSDSMPATASIPNTPFDASPLEDPMGVNEEFAPATSAFASARTAIDTALERGELQRAHLLLSGWYGDRSLTTTEREEVEGLLAQLAGTVIYSPEHRLEAPHRVQTGETLETVAQKYNVPWQLLAKINGISQPSDIMPGQELKVIRGPFSAVVDVERQQLALMVADRYAGKFGVKTEGQAASEGEWVITQKQMPTGVTTKQMVLESAGGSTGGVSLVLGPTSDSGPATAGAIRVAPSDQNDLFDILSIGSRVIIRK